MLKNIFFLCLALFSVSVTKAQISYPVLDSLSALISKLEHSAAGITFTDANGNSYELGFPDEDFKVWTQNRLATKAMYKTAGSKETLSLSEDIDLTKATAIRRLKAPEGLAYVKVYFPSGTINTQIIENGDLTNTLEENALEFFCSSENANKLVDALYSLIIQLNVD